MPVLGPSSFEFRQKVNLGHWVIGPFMEYNLKSPMQYGTKSVIQSLKNAFKLHIFAICTRISY